MAKTIRDTLIRLEQSDFRSSFRLSRKDREYLERKGAETIRLHAYDFVNERLRPKEPRNDGRQTPMSGHPVFKAMHATACCCRGCLEKWYRIPRGVELSDDQVDRIVALILAWIAKEKEGSKNERTADQ